MAQKNIPNIRFKQLTDSSTNWINNNPVLMLGEFVYVSDLKRLKIGTGDPFINTEYFVQMNKWNKDAQQIDDSIIKPPGYTGKSTEDYIHIFNDIVYPITTGNAVKLKDGNNIQNIVDNLYNEFGTRIAKIIDSGSLDDYLGEEHVNIPYFISGGSSVSNMPMDNSHGFYVTLIRTASGYRTQICISNTNNIFFRNYTYNPSEVIGEWDKVYSSIDPQLSVTGNAGTATALKTAKNITIGNKVLPFDGSSDLTYTLNDIGALALSGGTVIGKTLFKDELVSEMGQYNYFTIMDQDPSGFIKIMSITVKQPYANMPIYFNIMQRHAKSVSAFTIRFQNVDSIYPDVDSFNKLYGESVLYLAKSAEGVWDIYASIMGYYDEYIIFNLSSRPTYFDIEYKSERANVLPSNSALFDIDTMNQNISGNAETATALKNTRNITIGNKTISTNGSSDLNYTLDAIGASPKNGSTSLSSLASVITLGDGGGAAIYQNTGSVQQKILISDHSLTDGNVYTFQLSTDSGSNFIELMAISDNGSVRANSFEGIASSATKLQIARNITIGNKILSFDGTSNISFSLSDIGAAASTHTHTVSNISDLDTYTQNMIQSSIILSNQDLDLVKTPGFYYAAGGNTIANKPDGVDYFGVKVYNSSLNSRTQDLVCGNQSNYSRFTRQLFDNEWSPWIPLPIFSSEPSSGEILISDGSVGNIKSSGFTIAKSVPSNALFTDTVYSHPNSGITAGTYKSVTVNAQGHITAGSNPTTLSGYGITDAAAYNHTHSEYATKPLIIKNISIATTDWNTSTNQYTYTNASITAHHSPDVRFSKSSLEVAGKAGIICYTESGKLILEYTTQPTDSITIEVAILTPV